MAKKEHVNKHPDWRLSARERFNYYLSDSGRLFGTSVFQTFMTAFLALRGVNLAVLAGVLLVLKIIDAVDDLLGYYRARGLYETYRAQLDYVAFYNMFLTASVRVCLADPDSDVLEKLMQWFLSHFPQWRENPYLRDMSPKYRLLTGLLMKRMRRSVKLIMGVNDRAKNKRG